MSSSSEGCRRLNAPNFEKAAANSALVREVEVLRHTVGLLHGANGVEFAMTTAMTFPASWARDTAGLPPYVIVAPTRGNR